MTDNTREEVNIEEPPTITPQVTNVQPFDKVPKDSLENFDIVGQEIVESQATTET